MSKKLIAITLLAVSGVWLTATANEPNSACNSAMSSALTENAYELWEGAASCADAEDSTRSTFLLLVGQIRAMTDMSVLEPAGDADQIKASELYGVLYYQAGGSGDDELLRDNNRTLHLFRQLRAWHPILDDSYDPGWSYSRSVDRVLYDNMIECQTELRIARLRWYAGLVRNDQYYFANKELRELLAENPGAVETETPVHAKMQEIMARMSSVSSDVPMPTEPPPECDVAMEYKPDPKADFRQLITGTNGLGDSAARVYESSDEVLKSWMAEALSPEHLGELLSEVDFDQQILVSLDFGERRNATGSIHLSDVSYNSVNESLQISGLIGVTESDCEESFAKSYPFVIGVAARPGIVPTHPGMFQQNFGDGCKPIMTGERTVLSE